MADKLDGVGVGLYNQKFIDALGDESLRRKIALNMGQYIRKKIYEGLVMEKIIPAQTVTATELTPTINGDTLYKIDELEPEARAMELNWDGYPTGELFEGERFITPFWIISTERYEKSEDELLAIRYPAREVLSEIAANEIIRVQDMHFFQVLCEGAVAISGKIVVSPSTVIDMDALSDLQNQLDGDELETKVIVINKVDFNNLKRLAGYPADILSSELITKGYTATTLGGINYIVTIKNDAVPAGTAWAFTAPEYLGTHYSLQDTKFEIKSEFRRVQFQSYRNIGFTIANVESVAKLTLSSS